MEDSLRVIDAALKTDFPAGPCWRRYTHDGYGQRDDGGPFLGWGRGRPWPLLTGERGHYELAAGRDPTPYLKAMERFANPIQLLPEQIWDQPDRPRRLLKFGGQTGSATPLMWAHAEYIKLLRSTSDGAVFDTIPESATAIMERGRKPSRLRVWKSNRRVPRCSPATACEFRRSSPLRCIGPTTNGSTSTTLGLRRLRSASNTSISTSLNRSSPNPLHLQLARNPQWEGRDYAVAIAR